MATQELGGTCKLSFFRTLLVLGVLTTFTTLFYVGLRNDVHMLIPPAVRPSSLWRGFNHAHDQEVVLTSYDDKNTTLPTVCETDHVLGSMLRGRWLPRHVTPEEEREIDQFYRRIRKDASMPENLQRSDKRCGNVGFPGAVPWARALCDVAGDTPCCFQNVCTKKTVAECTCTHCLDLRTARHAELSTWQPEDPAYAVRKMSVDEMCGVLSGSKLYFIGDSLIRHIYTAFLMMVRGDDVTGALKRETPPDVRKQCSGKTVFTEKLCRQWVDRETTLCNGTVQVTLETYYHIGYASQTHSLFFSLGKNNRSLFLLGIGLHNSLDAKAIQKKVVLPLLQRRASQGLNSSGPKLIWATLHSPGLLKNGRGTQGRKNVQAFNGAMCEVMRSWGVPVLDSYRATDGMVSLDGTHYGLGVNRLKAQVLMQYLSHLHSKHLW